ncbi:LlaJI family restriction endonuclease [Marinomonas rhizomae]|uniref:LlaJI family restriction endonuclease n=1 Tax=Marinomonas rhizomae TaxID=491948 RepID=UPI00210455E4|nr:LlaJI family restriction endonuclease [Marinomonas rhizomae]UTV99456.1 LlaJI family restriction endonuclease [Marinomonas rhizomae]
MVQAPAFYNDRQQVSSLPFDVRHELEKHNILKVGEHVVHFTGFVLGKDKLHVFLPRNTALSAKTSKQKLRNAALLMRGIRRYLNERPSIETAEEGDGDVGAFQLSLVTDLLEDFCTNGVYSKRFREHVKNTGKFNWKRTISSQTAFIGESGPVYLDIDGTRQHYVSDCEVARVHAQIIRKLDQSYSWIITGTDVEISGEISHIPDSLMEVEAQIAVLEKELLSVYAERDIRLIHLMIRYLKSTRGAERGSLIGLRHFHYMWEKMLDSSLKWVFPVNQLLAIPSYRFKDGTLKQAASKAQRTDTVLKAPKSNKYVVIDAKYYGASDIQSAPGWGDIVKQFFYAKALKVYAQNAEVGNAFVFPGSGPLHSVHMIERGKSRGVLDEDYPPIRCFYLDPMELIECYVNGSKLDRFSASLLSQKCTSQI